MCAPDPEQRHGTPREFISNWRSYEGPFLEKLRFALRNTWIKVRTRSDCCGNFGEPGC